MYYFGALRDLCELGGLRHSDLKHAGSAQCFCFKLFVNHDMFGSTKDEEISFNSPDKCVISALKMGKKSR